ncbi:MAG: AMP-binding protein [Candidatus Hodarchaeota archaeon]
MNIRELIEYNGDYNASKNYLFFEDQKISYQEFNNNINRIANGLLHLGIESGDKVCLLLFNSPEFLYSWFAVNKIGAVMIPINTGFKEDEMKYILDHSEARCIIFDQNFAEIINKIMNECKFLEKFICAGEMCGASVINLGEMMENSSTLLRDIIINEDDDAVYVYTSGTTGLPKGVMLSHRSLVLTGQSFSYTVGLRSDDRVMTPNPLFHANAQAYSTIGSLSVGASLVLIDKFSASRIWDQTRKYHAKKLVLVGAMTPMLWNQPRKDNDSDNPVETLVAGFVPKEYFEGFEKRFGVWVQTIFSLTECAMCIMGPRKNEGVRKIGGVGVPMQHPDEKIRNMVKIVDKSGNKISPNVLGEIIVNNPAIMKGYFKDINATTRTLKEGWVYTGDNGYIDEDGYFFFVAREKDIIRKKGENISPVELENVITKNPKVAEAAIIAVPSVLGHGEDEIKAYVVPSNHGKDLKSEEIVEWCAERLAPFKVPQYIEFRDSLPKTATGRVKKDVLRKEKEDLIKGCFNKDGK